ncbi:MAG: hypothetical protein OXF02_04915 [Simkaniaceae bacterium]|nr:hypothetical protein [Simkaniaceae bacterium]
MSCVCYENQPLPGDAGIVVARGGRECRVVVVPRGETEQTVERGRRIFAEGERTPEVNDLSPDRAPCVQLGRS